MNKLIVSLLSSLLFLMLFSHVSYGTIHYNLEDFIAKGTNSKATLISVDGDTFMQTGISPDIVFGPVDVGLDFNFYLPVSNSGPHPSDLQNLVIRHIQYSHGKKHGFRWGKLQNVTLGNGLLVDRYNSATGGTTQFNNNKAGFLGYTQFEGLRLKGMWTGNNVKAGRLQYRIADTPVAPLLIGGTYVTDSDGINDRQNEVTIIRPKQEGWSADISLPVGGQFFTLYTEYAELVNQGSGASAGFRGDIFQFGYKAEFRTLGARFVPGYFNSTYEATPFNFATDSLNKKINGFLIAGNVGFLNDQFRAGLEYEDYEGKNRLLTAAIGWKRFQNTVGVINYHIPFQGRNNAIANAEILYITGGWLDYIFNIKRTYITLNKFTESYEVGVRANLDKLLPFNFAF